jgi:hypothetical protein
MRRSTALLALFLVLLGAVAPLAEAVTGCVTGCPDDDATGRCGDAMCCACCVYAAPATVPAPTLAVDGPQSSGFMTEPLSHPLSVDPRDLLQVPKTGRA